MYLSRLVRKLATISFVLLVVIVVASNGKQTSCDCCPTTPTPTAYDFNQDGKPDYVLYDAVTHQTAVWYLNNNVFLGAAFGPTLPANWKVVGVADFDGDGRPDSLLFNSTSHQTAIWYLSGTTLVSSAFGPSLPNG